MELILQDKPENNPNMLKRGITLGEALALGLTLLGVVIGVYTTVMVTQNDHGTKIKYNEDNIENLKKFQDVKDDKINLKLDKISEDLIDIKVQLNNKADKKYAN